MPSPMRIDVAFPAANEAALVGETLTSIYGQHLDGRYYFSVDVLCNDCTDDTAQVAARTIASFESRNEIAFGVTELPQPGKNAALNVALGRSATTLFMYTDADVWFSPHCFTEVAD